MLIDWYLPGTKAGGPVRSIWSLMSLLQGDNDFYILTTNCDIDNVPYKSIQPDTWTKHEGIPVFYFSKEKLNAETLAGTINALGPDIVYLNSFWSYFFSILPLRLRKAGKIKGKFILAPRGMLGSGALSIKPLKKKIFIALSKLNGLHKGITFHATTKEEEKDIRKFFKNADVRVAPNVNAALPLKDRIVGKQPGELRLFFLSRVVRVKNLHFALETLAGFPSANIVYDIFGPMEDKAYWEECQRIIAKMPEGIRVNYKGELGFEAVQQTIRNYHYLFLPTLNENFGHSIVESLMSGCPVLISDQTPWNDVNRNNCGAALPLNDKEAFRSELKKALLLDAPAYAEISENCRTFIEARTDHGQSKAAYKALFYE